MNNLFVVRFIRADGGPDEEYYYHFEKDAIGHFRMFLDDDSDLYNRIQVEQGDRILATNIFRR